MRTTVVAVVVVAATVVVAAAAAVVAGAWVVVGTSLLSLPQPASSAKAAAAPAKSGALLERFMVPPCRPDLLTPPGGQGPCRPSGGERSRPGGAVTAAWGRGRP